MSKVNNKIYCDDFRNGKRNGNIYILSLRAHPLFPQKPISRRHTSLHRHLAAMTASRIVCTLRRSQTSHIIGRESLEGGTDSNDQGGVIGGSTMQGAELLASCGEIDGFRNR